jgi:cytochrome b subunit of formate dehydrogenase
MPKKNLHYYLLKTARVSAWLLLLLMLLYILTGFALCGKLGMGRLMNLQTALFIHQLFDWPLVAVFLIHVSITTYFTLRRWGWIKNKSKNCKL